MKAQRPNFKDIHSFEEFNCYYWYREELSQICKSLELEYQCTKKELNFIIEQYFKGNKITRNLNKDINFTIQDMIKIYYGESDYAKYDSSTCQWNQFLKDFCLDECSNFYSNKLKVASILWKEVRNSTNKKIYTRELLKKYEHKVTEYLKKSGSSSSN